MEGDKTGIRNNNAMKTISIIREVLLGDAGTPVDIEITIWYKEVGTP